MENTIISLKQKLDTLTVFRGLLEDPAVVSFMDLAFEIKDYLEDKSMEDDEDCFSVADPSEAVSAYCRFVSDIYGAGVSSAGRPAGDLSAYVRDLVMRDENFYVIGKAAGRKIGKQIEDSLERELAVLHRCRSRPGAHSCGTSYPRNASDARSGNRSISPDRSRSNRYRRRRSSRCTSTDPWE